MNQEKLMTSFIDVSIATVHELINENMRLKAEIRVMNDEMAEKNQVQNDLVIHLNSLEEEKRSFDEKISSLQRELEMKAHHLDTALEQLKSTNQIVREKDDRISYLSKLNSDMSNNSDRIYLENVELKKTIEKMKNSEKIVTEKKPTTRAKRKTGNKVNDF